MQDAAQKKGQTRGSGLSTEKVRLFSGRRVLGWSRSVLGDRIALLADLGVLGCLDAARVGAGLATLFGLIAATTGLELGLFHGRSGRSGGSDSQRGANGHKGEETEEVLYGDLFNEAFLGLIKQIWLIWH